MMDSSSLDLIAEQFALAVRRGDAPSVEEFIAQYPDAPDDLRRLLNSVALLEGLKEPESRCPESPMIRQLDDYKILREVGRGGMGIVFEAIHESLGRRVAIKVLSSGLLGDPKHLARFRREARAAAKLRHSNIVPVFGVGQHDGHHYYVMDFIDGMSLRETIDALTGRQVCPLPTMDQADSKTNQNLQMELSIGISNTDLSLDQTDSDPPRNSVAIDNRVPVFPNALGFSSTPRYRWAATVGATICDAIQYAHSQGVLHRDIKPANLLIDRQGGVWIADFGLAKLSEQHAMTATGDVVGTPQYMPPESFEGTYDVRSEVYATGLTLYELLTLRPAVEGKSPGDIIRKASTGSISRPSLHQSDLPRDLETIVLKCLAHDPTSRYATVGEVRDDLHRFLSDRPIAARRARPLERLVRWSRRQPAVASLTFATFGLLVALAAVSAIGYLQTKSALGLARTAKQSAEKSLADRTAALDNAEQQRQRAEKNLQVALTAFESMMQNISHRSIDAEEEFFGEVTDTTSPNVTPDDAKLLQSLLGFFDELGTNNSEDLLAESAVAARRAGEIYQRLGQLSSADQAYSEALLRYRTLASRDPMEVDFVISIAQLQNELAVIAGLRGQFSQANQLFQQTSEGLIGSPAAMNSLSGRFEYARAHRLFASIRARSGLDRMGSNWTSERGKSRMRRPGEAIVKNRIEDEFHAIDVAIETLQHLIKDSPNEVRFEVELARAFRDRAKLATMAKNRLESEAAIRQSIALFEKLLNQNSQSESIQYELATTLSSTEAFGFNTRVRAMQATKLSQILLEQAPSQPRYLALRAHTLATLAKFQLRNDGPAAALASLDEAIRIYNGLAEKSPELSLYIARLSQLLESKSDIQQQQGNTAGAIATLELAIEKLQQELMLTNDSRVIRIHLLRMRQKLSRLNDAKVNAP